MRVLVACETSGAVRNAFRALGHDAWSCDILPEETETSDGWNAHYRGDVFECLADMPDWDMMVAHPPCTYLSVSGLHWNKRRPERAAQTEEALEFVARLDRETRHIPRRCFENPIGCLSTRWRKPTQIIQPHQFGHDASKATCLWLDSLPRLVPTSSIAPRVVNGRPRWANQTDSGQNRLTPSPDRWKLRSETYQGVADAMATQWGEA